MSEFLTGRVLKSIRGHYWVETESGVFHCQARDSVSRMAQNTTPLTVGDLVRFGVLPDESGEGIIEEVFPRRTKLSRRSQAGARTTADFEDVVAANVDQLVIVSAAQNPPLRPGLIDRYLVAAGKGGLLPLICINKIDLTDPGDVEPVAGVYRRLGYPVFLTCAKSGRGVDQLEAALRDGISVFAGHSGVGKSTLLKRLCPGIEFRTAEVNTKTGKGRHTTTLAQLVRLPAGGYVIDTPGIRQFSIFELTPEDIQTYFEEISHHREGCRFRDCGHNIEPDCAVREALANGLIDPLRFESYLRLQQEYTEMNGY